ncbi:MAG: MarR family winged helix-turn-helix transcriptional regulator [Rhodospirillaceae bacterium]
MVETATALKHVDQLADQPLVDMRGHIPALSATLGGKIGLHALRHNARALGLDLREWRIIQILGSEGRSTVFAVADFIAMDRGGTSRSISRLEDRGYVQRKDDPADRRRSFVELTPEGWELHEKIVHFALAREERLLKNVSPEDAARLRDLLNTLIAEADQMVADGWTP